MNNYSKQREIILKVLENNQIHPTAEKIYELVSNNAPTISKSTIYRNLTILVEQGKLRKINMSVGPDRFEYVIKNHNHAICEICGKVFDFYSDLKIKSIEKDINFKVDNIILYGICQNCRSLNK